MSTEANSHSLESKTGSRSLFDKSGTAGGPEGGLPTADEFAYRPVPPLAPISLFMGVCGAAGFLGVPAMAIAVVGIICALLALWIIRRSEGALGGSLVAKLGLGLSLLMTLGAGALHTYTYFTEVPEGHQRLTFSWLSKQDVVQKGNELLISPDVIDLNDKPVFIKGYMYPSRQREGLHEFVLVKDTGDCCFGRQPKLSDMIVVHMKDGQTVKYREQQLVSVAGTFRIAGVHQAGDILGVYTLDGTHFR
ncbi:MAG: hypothetical protein ACK50P_04715 [Planctomycetaceae bacterium]|jgi:hypothetical protein